MVKLIDWLRFFLHSLDALILVVSLFYAFALMKVWPVFLSLGGLFILYMVEVFLSPLNSIGVKAALKEEVFSVVTFL